MSGSACLAAAVAGTVYNLTPGPGMLALFATVASAGRAPGVAYLAGEIVGDVLWSSLGLAAVLGVSTVGPLLSSGLEIACGLYLMLLGWRALTRPVGAPGAAVGGVRPFRTGLLMGVTNPKSYPVAVALFAVVAARYGDGVSWSAAPALVASMVAGFLVADVVQVGVAGLPAVRAGFVRHGRLIARCIGVVFVLLGARLTIDGARDLAARA